MKCSQCSNDVDLLKTGGNTNLCQECKALDSAKRYSAMNYKQKLLYPARKRAKLKGIEISITADDIVLNKICPLLKVKIDYRADKGGRGWSSPYSPSLDRIDSTKGYVPDNIWVVSKRANTIKSDASLEELELLVANFKKYLKTSNQ